MTQISLSKIQENMYSLADIFIQHLERDGKVLDEQTKILIIQTYISGFWACISEIGREQGGFSIFTN